MPPRQFTLLCKFLDCVLHLEYALAMEARIQTRIDQDLKTEGENILKQLGMSASDLVRLTFSQLVLRKGLPFDVKIPTERLAAAIKEADDGSTEPVTLAELAEQFNIAPDEEN